MKVTVTQDGTDHNDDLVVHFVPCLNIRGHDDVPITDLTVEDVAQMSPEERENYHHLMTTYVLSDHCPGGQAMVCWGAGEEEVVERQPPQHEGEELERLSIQQGNNNNNNIEAVKELDEAMDVGDHVAGCPGEGHEDGHCLLLSQLMRVSPLPWAPPPSPQPPTPPPLVVDLCSARVQDYAYIYREFFAALDQLDL